MARARYSTFYFLARATLLIAYEPRIYFEDAFTLLAAATENADRFVKVWQRGLWKDLNLSSPSLCRINDPIVPGVEDVRLYRNVLLHAPVLGRAHYLNSEFLPKKHLLSKDDDEARGAKSKSEGGWPALQKLPFENFVEGRTLLTKLRAEFVRGLRDAWVIICEVADGAPEKKEYRELYNLDEQYHIRALSEPIDGRSFNGPTLNIHSAPASGASSVVGSAIVYALLSGDPALKPKP